MGRALHESAVLCFILLICFGCASTSTRGGRDAGAAWEEWSAEYGGVLDSARMSRQGARIGRALGSLEPLCGCGPVSVRILDDDRVAAFAFRDGSLFVTRGLLRAMDDAELTAALAHEMGHLVETARSFPRRDAEQRADGWGAALLERSGRSAGGMLRMLAKLERHTDPGFHGSIRARVRLLEAELAEAAGRPTTRIAAAGF